MADADVLEQLRRNRVERERLDGERDALILEAAAASPRIPVTHIAEAVGLDRTHVHRIIRAAGPRYRLAADPIVDLDVEEVRLADGSRLTDQVAQQIAADAIARANEN